MTAIAIATLLAGLLLFVLSQPLIRRQIPRNRMYGIRIPAAFESDQRWYDINAYGGRQLANWSWLTVAAGAAGFFIPPAHLDLYLYASLGATLLAVMMPLILVSRWSRRRH